MKKTKDNNIQDENNDNKGIELYCDKHQAKGNMFQDNVNMINNLYFGQGSIVSDSLLFVYMDEKEKKRYISTNCLIIEAKLEDKEIKNKMICYPINFLMPIFYHDHQLFYLNHQNEIIVFKFDKSKVDSFIRHKSKRIIEKTKKEKNEKQKKTKKTEEPKYSKELIDTSDNVTEIRKSKKTQIILKKLNEIDGNEALDKNYEILCDILKNDLGENIEEIKNSKLQYYSEPLMFSVKDDKYFKPEYRCIIKSIKYELDGFGQLKEELKLQKGAINFEKGIKSLIQYINLKKNNDIQANKYIDNSLKCPILYKNFDEEIIPPNQSLIFGMKSGFDLKSVKSQLEKRIDLVNNCFFPNGERPLYFIGIINLNSDNMDKLNDLLKQIIFNFKSKTLIVTSVDYEYCLINIKTEVNEYYLLNKKIEKIESKVGKIESKLDKMELALNENNQLIKDLISVFSNIPMIKPALDKVIKRDEKLEEKKQY